MSKIASFLSSSFLLCASLSGAQAQQINGTPGRALMSVPVALSPLAMIERRVQHRSSVSEVRTIF